MGKKRVETIGVGDFVWIRDLEGLRGDGIEDDYWGIVIDRDREGGLKTGKSYQVATWNGEGKYQDKTWYGERNLSKMVKGNVKLGASTEKGFWPGDRVRMVDGMEGRLLNSWGLMFEWGVVKEVEGNEVRVGFWKDGMERVEYWCLEGQLERVERGESGK